MPSSSTHNTYLERRIQAFSRRAYVYLLAADEKQYASVILNKFSEVLDVDPHQLYAVITSRPNLQRAKELEDIRAEAHKHDDSNKVWLAGGLLIEVGFSLDKVGRVQEAHQWCLLGTELQTIGENMAEVAKKRARQKEEEEARWYGRGQEFGRVDGGLCLEY